MGTFTPTSLSLFQAVSVPHFVIVPEEKYICQKCSNILRPPVKQTTCGHRLCSICVTEVFRRCERSNCPGNDEFCDTLVPQNIYPDRGTDKELSRMPVFCSYKELGCKSRGPWKDLQRHESECIHRPLIPMENKVSCPTLYETLDQINDKYSKLKQLHNEFTSKENVNGEEISLINEKLKKLREQNKALHNTIDVLDSKVEKVIDGHQMLSARVDVSVNMTDTLQEQQQAITKNIDVRLITQERKVGIHDLRLAECDLRFRCLESASYGGKLIWKIEDYFHKKEDAITGRLLSLYSQPFYTSTHGYKMCARIHLNGHGLGKNTHVSLFFVLMKGDYDALLPWPFRPKVTFTLIEQNDKKENISETLLPDPRNSFFGRPVGDMNIPSGFPLFVSHGILESGRYIQDNALFIHFNVDISSLTNPLQDVCAST